VASVRRKTLGAGIEKEQFLLDPVLLVRLLSDEGRCLLFIQFHSFCILQFSSIEHDRDEGADTSITS
jgi:hypothetical protein